ncbi:MAG: hypothetical protein CVU38_10805 [Chloroflexi bacterium HGW-Chloroflexi-1]|nr:MAG: hypothetical protein CVU38_10805 [Chloroflexi bacterium HGW-Chloroflexi-1]
MTPLGVFNHRGGWALVKSTWTSWLQYRSFFFLLAFAPSFGFSADEAAHAGLVTIVADRTAVSQESEAALGLDGTPVQRIAGTVAEVAAALAARVEAGQPFV